MARDYKRAAKQPPNDRPPGSWLSFLTGLGIGLVGAVVMYWWLQSTGPYSTPTPAEEAAPPVADEPPMVEAPVPPPAAEGEQLSLPKFDFYKILPEIEVKVPEDELAESKTEPAPPAEPRQTGDAGAAFMLQIASFQNFDDADQAKAQLALQGVQATIQRVVINGQDVWHRVHVGPFSTLVEAQQMRARLSQLGVNAIVLKLGGGGQ